MGLAREPRRWQTVVEDCIVIVESWSGDSGPAPRNVPAHPHSRPVGFA